MLTMMPAALALVGWQDASAFNPQPDPPGFSGMVGITHGQLARLNAVKVSRQPTDGLLFFLDRTGATLQAVGVRLQHKPALVAATSGDYRWRKYLEKLRLPKHADLHHDYARYTIDRWNPRHAANQHIQTLHIYSVQ